MARVGKRRQASARTQVIRRALIAVSSPSGGGTRTQRDRASDSRRASAVFDSEARPKP
jgi:hypothetical protein